MMLYFVLTIYKIVTDQKKILPIKYENLFNTRKFTVRISKKVIKNIFIYFEKNLP